MVSCFHSGQTMAVQRHISRAEHEDRRDHLVVRLAWKRCGTTKLTTWMYEWRSHPNLSKLFSIPVSSSPKKGTQWHFLLAKRLKAELSEDMCSDMCSLASLKVGFRAHNAWLPGHSSWKPLGGCWAWWEAGVVRRLWRHYHQVRTVAVVIVCFATLFLQCLDRNVLWAEIGIE